MEQNAIKPYNFHDYFIMFIVISTIAGTAQVGLIGHTFMAGLLCLPAAIKEIYNSLRQKVQPVIAFMILLILYVIISILWTPQKALLLQEIWNIGWNIIIFIGLYNHSRYARNTNESLLIGLRTFICLTLIVASWEIITDSHIPGFGDFNEGSEIKTMSGSEHRIFAAVTYKNLNSYVTILCMALPFLIYGLFVLQKKWISLVAIIGSIIILIINSSRGGLMCLAIDLIVFICLYRKQQFRYKKALTVLALLLVIGFVYRYGLLIAEQSIGRISAYGAEEIMSDAGRWDVWRMGIEFCISSWGFGHGVGSMQPMYASTGFWLHYSHNLVIEFLMQYGIWLFIPLAAMILKNWIFLIKAEQPAQKMLGWMLLTSFVPLAIIDDTYLIHAFFWIWLILQFVITNNLQNQTT